MSKQKHLKIKKDKMREKRKGILYRKRHYKETVDYALNCFFKEICSI